MVVGHGRSSDPVLLWLWHRPAATAPIGPLVWEPPYAMVRPYKDVRLSTQCALHGLNPLGEGTPFLIGTGYCPLKKWCVLAFALLSRGSDFFFFSFKAAPVTYGSSQTRSNRSYVCQPQSQPQQCQIQATSSTYTTAHCNARSLTTDQGQGLNLCPHGY